MSSKLMAKKLLIKSSVFFVFLILVPALRHPLTWTLTIAAMGVSSGVLIYDTEPSDSKYHPDTVSKRFPWWKH